jgi:pimeloyl-ACP methyl ester carboxylesterase
MTPHDPLGSLPEGRVRLVESADGTILHAEVFGPEDGATVVLVHGWTEGLQYWIYVITADRVAV